MEKAMFHDPFGLDARALTFSACPNKYLVKVEASKNSTFQKKKKRIKETYKNISSRQLTKQST